MTGAQPQDWRAVNLANWESRVPIHTSPGGYRLADFDDPDYLSSTVRYDQPRLGCLDGLDVVHLQCHIGTDTASLARLGARAVTGLDFSPSAIAVCREVAARAAAARAGDEVAFEFVVADLYDAIGALGSARYDLVYTGIGALCWLPDIAGWAEVIAGLLRPGGRLFLREGHPMLWAMCDPRPDGLLVVQYPYFESPGIVFTETETYLGDGTVGSPDSVGFNHGLGEIFTALTRAGLQVRELTEHRELPWNALGDAMIPSPEHPEEFVLADQPERLPLSYTLQAFAPAS